MSKQIEPLKLALEALVAAFQGKDKTGQVTDAITAIREALAEQPSHEEMERIMQEIWQDVPGAVNFGIRPPAQEQELKRWAVFCSQCRKEWSVSYPHPGKSICAECDAKVEAQQQEPVLIGWDTKTDKPIYTTVSPRKPLTYVEIERLYYKCAKYQEEPMEVSGWQEFARAIEAAHGITGETK